MRAGIGCPTCGYVDSGDELNDGDDYSVCRHCGAYLQPGPRYGVTAAQPAHVARRDESPGVYVALRTPDGRYGATSIPEARVDPGAHVEFVVRVTNNSPIVERIELSIEIDGEPDRENWSRFHQQTLDLLPFRRSSSGGHERETLLTVRFPYSSQSRAGPWPIRVVAYSSVLKRRVASAGAVVTVAPYAILSLDLDTPSLRARRSARTELAVVNDGNTPADVELSARDDAGLVHFVMAPERIRVAVGDEGRARVGATVKRGMWFGRPELHHFQVAGTAPTGRKPVIARGTFQQRPYLPRWVLLLPALVAAAVALWLARSQHVRVPDVRALGVRAAELAIVDRGLEPKERIVPAADPRHPSAAILRQDPAPDESVAKHSMVTIVIEEGAGKVPVPKLIALGLSDARKRLHQAGFRLGAVDPDPPPAAATVRRQDPAEDALALRGTSVAVALTVPAPDQGPPVAFVDGGRILLKTPGRSARPLAGGEGIDDTDPAWDPRTGELAFAERRPPAGDAAIVAIDPASPDVPHRLSGPGGSYTSPGFSPRGDLLAAVDDDGSGYGGRLCLFAPPARVAHCRTDASWRYGRPAFGDERTLYALRRNTSTRRRGGWDQLLRLTAQAPGKVGPRAWVPDPNPVVEGDLLSVAVASDGRLAALVRDPGKAYYHVEVLSPDGSLQQAQTGAEPSCELAWSAKDLLVSRWSCTEDHPPGDVIRLPADDLNGPAQKIVAQGEDPAPEPM